MKFSQTRLLVKDHRACFLFYRDVMGFPVTWGSPDSDFASFQVNSDANLALFSRAEQIRALGGGHLPLGSSLEGVEIEDHFMLAFTVDDLEAAVQALSARGAAFVRSIEAHPEWGIRTAYLRDPDGNLIEINSEMPTTEWSQELRDESQRYE